MPPGAATRVIDTGGKVVAPGFIDIHTHARRGILQVPTADNYVRQGVTTLMEGPDGSSPLPIKEEDLQRILRHSATMIGSDGEIPIFGQANPHPRSYGTFVRGLGRYVRDLHVISLEEAVRKMSAFPAARIGLHDRGVLKVSMKADIAIFDPATVRDLATFEQAHQYAEGVAQVIVNGLVAFENRKMTAARPGRILYGPSTAIAIRSCPLPASRRRPTG